MGGGRGGDGWNLVVCVGDTKPNNPSNLRTSNNYHCYLLTTPRSKGEYTATLTLGLGVILIRCFRFYFCQIFINVVIKFFCNMCFRDRRFSFYMPKVLFFG